MRCMIKIDKQAEPQEWKHYRCTTNANYTDAPAKAKNVLRQSLLEEQGFICAYCMGRINNRTSKIEHIKSQSKHSDLQLHYDNMVACCKDETTEMQHCDTSKGNQEISFSLFDEAFIKTLQYGTKDGEITSSNTQWDKEIKEILRLNAAILKANRSEVLKAITQWLGNSKGEAVKSDVQHKLTAYINKDVEGKKKPYCGIVIWYLKRWLCRH